MDVTKCSFTFWHPLYHIKVTQSDMEVKISPEIIIMMHSLADLN